MSILKAEFFTRPVLEVAPDLLGKVLIHQNGEERQEVLLTEVEAYDGEQDLACHASRGRTQRTEVLYGPAGVWYVYLIYGMYDMLNIVTSRVDYPAAVLLRGGVVKDSGQALDGPGKLTRALGITRTYNQQPAVRAANLWLEDQGIAVNPANISKTPRIGVDYAGIWADKPYRFIWQFS
jgi:DNA-3-methyladenine glycosylase